MHRCISAPKKRSASLLVN